MLKGFASKLEIVANFSIVLASVALLATLIKSHYGVEQTPHPARIEEVRPGQKLSLPGNIPSSANHAVVLALSTQCRFCTESAPFYRRLSDSLHREKRAHIVAVLPQPLSEGKQYLDSMGVMVDEVIESPLDRIRVRATPTILLLDSRGIVSNIWSGKIPSGYREDEVLRILGEKMESTRRD